MKLNTQAKAVLIVSAAVITLVAVGIGALVFVNINRIQNRVFTDIGDFQKLDQYAVKDIEASKDKNLKRLVPQEFYTKEILYEENTYSVYAYVFEDTESASMYFENYTGKKSDREYNFSMTTNLFSSKYIVYYGGCLYCIEGGSYKDFAEAVNFINESFAVDLKKASTNSR